MLPNVSNSQLIILTCFQMLSRRLATARPLRAAIPIARRTAFGQQRGAAQAGSEYPTLVSGISSLSSSFCSCEGVTNVMLHRLKLRTPEWSVPPSEPSGNYEAVINLTDRMEDISTHPQ
jgi:hypothetical protein